MRKIIRAFIFVVLPFAAALIAARPGVAQPRTAAPSSVALTWMDRTADACTDFYQFACGSWRTSNPVPADRQRWGQFAVLEEQDQRILRNILEGPVPASDRPAFPALPALPAFPALLEVEREVQPHESRRHDRRRAPECRAHRAPERAIRRVVHRAVVRVPQV